MAEATYTVRVIVLRKTKLGEADLVLTMLADDGSQLRAVAKGARKPKSSFAARLELYARADVLIARGRSLDIVKEARLVKGYRALHEGLEQSACAAAAAELAARVSQPGLAMPRLFPMTEAALDWMDRTEAPDALAICAAHLLKTMALAGFRPSFDVCASCGEPARSHAALGPEGPTVSFSYAEGGVLCPACAAHADALRVPVAVCACAHTLLASTFEQVAALKVPVGDSFAVLRLTQGWAREHVGANLKSLRFLFESGLF